jgi:GTPase SAR1 family protein
MTNIIITDEFSNAFNSIENTTEHHYITGQAGTGKSTFLEYLRDNTKKKTVVVAPTGISAIRVGGQTIHSLFKFPLGLLTSKDIELNHKKFNLFANLEMLIIDEISMVRADLIDAIDYALRQYKDEEELPFGGVQLVMFGDLYQLPPVVTKEERNYMDLTYNSPYFFDSLVIKQIELKTISFNRIFRQTDLDFIDILNKIRVNNITQLELNKLNERCVPIDYNKDNPIILTTINSKANYINEKNLEKIKEKEYTFEAIISGNFDTKTVPTEVSLKLKVGAQIRMVKNDIQKRWFNGSIGKITDIKNNYLMAEVDDELTQFVHLSRDRRGIFHDRLQPVCQLGCTIIPQKRR